MQYDEWVIIPGDVNDFSQIQRKNICVKQDGYPDYRGNESLINLICLILMDYLCGVFLNKKRVCPQIARNISRIV